jgi:deoxyribodipyrimidine photolyase-like uncharacterized protein
MFEILIAYFNHRERKKWGYMEKEYMNGIKWGIDDEVKENMIYPYPKKYRSPAKNVAVKDE